jgi:glycosyltransferase involved in cell wall biosynthesis
VRSDLLHVVTCISNPVRYRSRWRLHERFAAEMARAGVNLVTVELAYGERPFAVTTAGNRNHVQVRSRSELWSKENLLNIGIAHLPDDWRYVAWIDADVQFHNPDWAAETVERLQLFSVLQLFSHAHDLDPEHQVLACSKPKTGFMHAYWEGLPASKRYDDGNWHPGYAWAIRREAYVALGGLMDFCVLGSADRHMAMALVGKAELSLHRSLSPAYRKRILAWQDRAERHLRRNVNYVPGLLTHWWHGKKRDRRYVERRQILRQWQFDPDLDLRRDWSQHGLLELTDRCLGLRDDIRRYLRARNEDSIDVV